MYLIHVLPGGRYSSDGVVPCGFVFAVPPLAQQRQDLVGRPALGFGPEAMLLRDFERDEQRPISVIVVPGYIASTIFFFNR